MYTHFWEFLGYLFFRIMLEILNANINLNTDDYELTTAEATVFQV